MTITKPIQQWKCQLPQEMMLYICLNLWEYFGLLWDQMMWYFSVEPKTTTTTTILGWWTTITVPSITLKRKQKNMATTQWSFHSKRIFSYFLWLSHYLVPPTISHIKFTSISIVGDSLAKSNTPLEVHHPLKHKRQQFSLLLFHHCNYIKPTLSSTLTRSPFCNNWTFNLKRLSVFLKALDHVYLHKSEPNLLF